MDNIIATSILYIYISIYNIVPIYTKNLYK